MLCIRKNYCFSIILQSFITENENGIRNTAPLPYYTFKFSINSLTEYSSSSSSVFDEFDQFHHQKKTKTYFQRHVNLISRSFCYVHEAT